MIEIGDKKGDGEEKKIKCSAMILINGTIAQNTNWQKVKRKRRQGER